ncbi:helix-turn-helix domain-containing protein [Frigidibacter sp. MR17.24]|uniref:helix-turn-helix domain-containing protein n=1 Tax=Frigidibacter sp. MR17.24 TaxID=3127345 RepID=UPI0030130468
MTAYQQIEPTLAYHDERSRRIAERMIHRGVSPVAAWRMTLGLRRLDLAARARLDPERLARIERRESLPVRDELMQICAALAVEDYDLAEREIREPHTRMYGAH